jgi:N-methylhydantoinase A
MLADADLDAVNQLLAEMEGDGAALLSQSGVGADEISHERYAEMRYLGQGHEVRVPLPSEHLRDAEGLVERFEREYERLYGRRGPDVPVEAINWRVVSSGPRPELELTAVTLDAASRPPRSSRPAYFPTLGGFAETPVFDRYALEPGTRLDGPAIVEERESTLVVGPGYAIEVTRELALTVTPRGA